MTDPLLHLGTDYCGISPHVQPFRHGPRIGPDHAICATPACANTFFRLRADATKLELAFACLMSNFLHHGGGACAIATAQLPDGSVSITVRDNGTGISPEFQARIWQAFAVGQTVHTRGADGIGLGLPLTRRIVELHGGELDLLHDAGGMTAMIRLPCWRMTGSAP